MIDPTEQPEEDGFLDKAADFGTDILYGAQEGIEAGINLGTSLAGSAQAYMLDRPDNGEFWSPFGVHKTGQLDWDLYDAPTTMKGGFAAGAAQYGVGMLATWPAAAALGAIGFTGALVTRVGPLVVRVGRDLSASMVAFDGSEGTMLLPQTDFDSDLLGRVYGAVDGAMLGEAFGLGMKGLGKGMKSTYGAIRTAKGSSDIGIEFGVMSRARNNHKSAMEARGNIDELLRIHGKTDPLELAGEAREAYLKELELLKSKEVANGTEAMSDHLDIVMGGPVNDMVVPRDMLDGVGANAAMDKEALAKTLTPEGQDLGPVTKAIDTVVSVLNDPAVYQDLPGAAREALGGAASEVRGEVTMGRIAAALKSRLTASKSDQVGSLLRERRGLLGTQEGAVRPVPQSQAKARVKEIDDEIRGLAGDTSELTTLMDVFSYFTASMKEQSAKSINRWSKAVKTQLAAGDSTSDDLYLGIQQLKTNLDLHETFSAMSGRETMEKALRSGNPDSEGAKIAQAVGLAATDGQSGRTISSEVDEMIRGAEMELQARGQSKNERSSRVRDADLELDSYEREVQDMASDLERRESELRSMSPDDPDRGEMQRQLTQRRKNKQGLEGVLERKREAAMNARTKESVKHGEMQFSDEASKGLKRGAADLIDFIAAANERGDLSGGIRQINTALSKTTAATFGDIVRTLQTSGLLGLRTVFMAGTDNLSAIVGRANAGLVGKMKGADGLTYKGREKALQVDMAKSQEALHALRSSGAKAEDLSAVQTQIHAIEGELLVLQKDTENAASTLGGMVSPMIEDLGHSMSMLFDFFNTKEPLGSARMASPHIPTHRAKLVGPGAAKAVGRGAMAAGQLPGALIGTVDRTIKRQVLQRGLVSRLTPSLGHEGAREEAGRILLEEVSSRLEVDAALKRLDAIEHATGSENLSLPTTDSRYPGFSRTKLDDIHTQLDRSLEDLDDLVMMSDISGKGPGADTRGLFQKAGSAVNSFTKSSFGKTAGLRHLLFFVDTMSNVGQKGWDVTLGSVAAATERLISKAARGEKGVVAAQDSFFRLNKAMNSANPEERIRAAAAMQFGVATAMTLGTAHAVSKFGDPKDGGVLITGAPPMDRAMAATWRAEGRQPFSLYVKGKPYPMDRFMFSRPMMMVALMGDVAESLSDTMGDGGSDDLDIDMFDAMSMVSATFASSMLSGRMNMEGLSNFVKIIGGGEESVGAAEDALLTLLPLGGVARDVAGIGAAAGIVDDNFAAATITVLERLKKRVGMGTSGKRRDLNGNVIGGKRSTVDKTITAFTGISPVASNNQALSDEMLSHNRPYSKPPTSHGGVSLLDLTNDKGQNAWDRWQELMAQPPGMPSLTSALLAETKLPYFQKLPAAATAEQDSPRGVVFDEIRSEYRSAALDSLKEEFPEIEIEVERKAENNDRAWEGLPAIPRTPSNR